MFKSPTGLMKDLSSQTYLLTFQPLRRSADNNVYRMRWDLWYPAFRTWWQDTLFLRGF